MNEITKYDPNYNYEEIVQQQAQQSTFRPVFNSDEDTNKWEIDLDPIWDSIKHHLMGEIEEKGVWVRSDELPRRMNEKGATIVTLEVKARIHKGLVLSDLGQKEIDDICYEVGCVVSDQLANRWREFEVRPYESEFESVSLMIVDNLRSCLNTAKDGGMKSHRERSKFANPIAYANQHLTQNGGL